MTARSMQPIGLFVPCFVDQFHPQVGVAALRVLEALDIAVEVCTDAVCCGQPMANAGFAADGEGALARCRRAFEPYDTVVVLSGSCTSHVVTHEPGRQGPRIMEFTAYVHDVVGVPALTALRATYEHCVALHIGCHALRTLHLAGSTEIQQSSVNTLQGVLSAVDGLSFAALQRPDECCGFGGSFSVGEPDVSVKMGRDRLRDFRGASRATAVVSTDMSCLMHLRGVDADRLPMLHVAEVLATGLPDA
ncbi:MAG: (Fe-S)-binding protein [Gemmatimonadaceae bacterium]